MDACLPCFFRFVHKSRRVPTLQDGESPSDYVLLGTDVLGNGGYAQVRRGVCQKTGFHSAVKCMSKGHENFDEAVLVAEVDLMESTNHPNIPRLYSYFQTQWAAYVVLELCEGGDLFTRTASQPLEERDGAFVAVQLLQVLAFLHDLAIVHRDVKPENCLFSNSGPVLLNILKLADFGLATRFDFTSAWPLTESLGTRRYAAPEVLSGRYGPKCDVWSCGVTVYSALSSPCDDDSVTTCLRAGNPWSCQSKRWAAVGNNAKKLIGQLLQLDVERRPSAAVALQDRWLSSEVSQPSAVKVGAEPSERRLERQVRKLVRGGA